jgi:hypothetical protein
MFILEENMEMIAKDCKALVSKCVRAFRYLQRNFRVERDIAACITFRSECPRSAELHAERRFRGGVVHSQPQCL